MRISAFRALLLSFAFIASFDSGTNAEFAIPSLAPVDRLIKNTQAYLDAHPGNAEAYYMLGRIHYMAFIHDASFLPQYRSEQGTSQTLQWVPEDRNPASTDFAYDPGFHHAYLLTLRDHGYASPSEVDEKAYFEIRNEIHRKHDQLKREGWQPPKPNVEELQGHAAKAAVNLRKAVELDPAKDLYFLTLASFTKQYLDFVEKDKVQDRPAELKDATMDEARDLFFQAYSLAIEGDLKSREKPPYNQLDEFIGYEAGNAYLNLLPKEDALSKEEEKTARKVRRNLKRLERLPESRIVTPIIFTFREHSSIANLVSSKLRVRFDLDGTGVAREWSWVRPDTGILVWDPEGTGKVSSGRQLFGNVTWWMFFPNGYVALDALDDSRDGWLRNGELAGIAVWFDRNSNGISDKGEVVGLSEIGIRGISARGAMAPDGTLMNRAGLLLSSGKTLPTYDWIAESRTVIDALPARR